MRSHRIFTWMCLTACAFFTSVGLALDCISWFQSPDSPLYYSIAMLFAVLGTYSASMRTIDAISSRRAVKGRGHWRS